MTAIRTFVLAAAAAILLPSIPALAQSTDLFSGFGAKGKGPIEVDAKTLEIIEEGEQRISTFSGGVTVTRGNTTMKAAQIKLFSNKDAEATDQNGFTRMEATGTVYVNSGKQTVTGRRRRRQQGADHHALRRRRPQPGQGRARRRPPGDRHGDRAGAWSSRCPASRSAWSSPPTRRRRRTARASEAGTAPATQ